MTGPRPTRPRARACYLQHLEQLRRSKGDWRLLRAADARQLRKEFRSLASRIDLEAVYALDPDFVRRASAASTGEPRSV